MSLRNFEKLEEYTPCMGIKGTTIRYTGEGEGIIFSFTEYFLFQNETLLFFRKSSARIYFPLQFKLKFDFTTLDRNYFICPQIWEQIIVFFLFFIFKAGLTYLKILAPPPPVAV